MAYKHQIFISYSSKDRPWAEQLYLRLKQDGFTCFWDKNALRAGDDWETVILNDLTQSQHMLVLWSQDAKQSDWVYRERGCFDALPKTGANRRLLFVQLDDDAGSLKRFQQITHFKDNKLYPGQVEEAMKAPSWDAVINEIKDAVNADPHAITVSVAALALTGERFAYLYKSNMDGFADKVHTALQSIGIDYTTPELWHIFQQRYGSKAADWKPFNGVLEVRQILETVRQQVNQHIPPLGRRIRWQWVDEKFYTGSDGQSKQELRKLPPDAPCLFVVDPISLNDNLLLSKFKLLDDYFEDDKTALLVLTPVVFGYHPELLGMLRDNAADFFETFYERVCKRYAHCGVNVCDQHDIGRLLRAAIGPHVYTASSAAADPYTVGTGLTK